jgi:hypothetical protein
MIKEQMGFMNKVWEEWKAQGVLKSGEVKCVWDESCKKEGAKEMEVIYQQQASKQKGIQIKVKFKGIEIIKELMKMFGWAIQWDLENRYCM